MSDDGDDGKLGHVGGDADGQAVEYALRFEIMIYKVREDEYVLDVQRLEGELFLFLDVCGRLLGDMRL